MFTDQGLTTVQPCGSADDICFLYGIAFNASFIDEMDRRILSLYRSHGHTRPQKIISVVKRGAHFECKSLSHGQNNNKKRVVYVRRYVALQKKYIVLVYGTKLQLTTSRVRSMARRTLIFLQWTNICRENALVKSAFPALKYWTQTQLSWPC